MLRQFLVSKPFDGDSPHIIVGADDDPLKEDSPIAIGPECPICGRHLDSSTTNQQLNEHIDVCLNKDVLTTGTVKKPPSSLSSWLTKK